MRLLSVLTATVLLAVSTFTGTFGVPVSGADVQSQLSQRSGLSKRAPPIPMDEVAYRTWQGKLPPNVFMQTEMPDHQIKAYAKATYDKLVKKASPILVAVI
ncbi:hypothetical protein BU24DRAFT_416036 [Aaosphaeria arxii CBS 175.79]|uniref:Uncharacterized protein n=1 Tax=Aaosphaeria arxii CBS 175.79 TaxID=1450172 RepID=A0A6A5X5T8_9PLEO|nr:uncharacterized protein BU24DRAFT_416036 [Aaosphaeria arxii CBS 175.79]KAF2008260.1 hypothetical protein BU24DRAFT_416036 [Aaosphaeria arxii CBS 175.79]